MDREKLLGAFVGMSLAGLAVAGYQTYEHYFLASSVCDFTSTFSCTTVTGSRFGEFPPGSGLATAAWGVLWWAGAAVLGYGMLKGRKWMESLDFYTFAYTGFGVLFAAYLLVVELYLLPQETGTLAICPLCTVQHVFILLMFIISYTALEKPVKEYLEEVFYTEE